jgi:hypothetical protein
MGALIDVATRWPWRVRTSKHRSAWIVELPYDCSYDPERVEPIATCGCVGAGWRRAGKSR